MAVFDFSQIPANANALAVNINDLERRYVTQRRQDAAFNALESTYGPIAGDPERADALQQIGINREAADIAQGQFGIQQDANTRAGELQTQTLAANQGELTDADAMRERQGFLEAAQYVQSQAAAGTDPGKAFDQIAPRLNLTPEQAAEIRAEIVANPMQLDDLIRELGGGAAAETVPPVSSALIDAQQGAIINAMRAVQLATQRGENPVETLRTFLPRLGLTPQQQASLEQIAGNPAALADYIAAFGNQDALLARNQELERIRSEEGQEAYDRALASLRVTTPGQAQAVAAGRATGTGQGEALLNLPQMAQNIAQVDDRVDDVLDPARAPEFQSLFGLPSWRGFTEGGLGYLGTIPGTGAANAAADLEGIMGDISAAAYNSLRGGGQITEAERESVERSYATLQRSQSWNSFQRNLREFQLNLYRIYERMQRVAQGDFNDFVMADPTQDNWARDLFRVNAAPDAVDAAAAPAAGGQLPTVTDQAGYDALPPGARFLGPDENGRMVEWTK